MSWKCPFVSPSSSAKYLCAELWAEHENISMYEARNAIDHVGPVLGPMTHEEYRYNLKLPLANERLRARRVEGWPEQVALHEYFLELATSSEDD